MAKNANDPIGAETVLEKALSGELEGADLTKISLKKAELQNAKLKGATLSRATLKKADLKGADLSGADLTKADLSDADLTGADLTGANLTGVYAKGAVFNQAIFTKAFTPDANFTGASFKEAALSDADLSKAVFNKCDFAKAQFKNVKFIDSDATDSELSESDFSGADITNSSFQNCKIEKITAAKIVGKDADFSLSSIADSDFSGAGLEGADFANTLLERVSFAECDLKNALFNVSEHVEVNFDKAAIEGASFKSLSGYTEAEVMTFKERGASVDLFLLRRFGRMLKGSRIAQIVFLVTIVAIALGAYFYVSNPRNWSFEKLDRVAQVAKGRTQIDKAIRLYSIILEKFATNHIKVTHAKNQIASLYLEKGEFDKADEIFDEVLTQYPDLENAVVIARMGKADVLRGRKKYTEAIAAYNKIAEEFSDFQQALEAKDRIAKIHMELGDPDKAMAMYEAMKAADSENENVVVQADFNIADLLRDQGRNEEALLKYTQIFQAHKDDAFTAPRALSSMLQVYVVQGEINKAEQVLAQIQKLFPDDVNTYLDSELFVANALSSQGKADEAEKRLRAVYDKYKDKMQGYWAGVSLADLLVVNKRYDEADQLLTELEARWGDREQYGTKFRIKKARILRAKKDYAKAIADLNALMPGIEDMAQMQEAQILLAELYVEAGQYDQGKALYDKIIAEWANKPDTVTSAMIGLARLYELKKDVPAALTQLQKIVDTASNPTAVYDAQFSMVRIYREQEKTDKEIATLEDMISRHEDNVDRMMLAKTTLAEVHRREKQYEKALEILQPLTDGEPRYALEALTGLVRIYSDMGQADKAQQISREIAQRFPDKKKALFSAELDAANSLLSSGQTDKALDKFKAIAASAPKAQRDKALGSILHIHVDRGDIEKARTVYAQLESELPKDHPVRIDAQLGLANLLRAKKIYPESEKLYLELIEGHKGKMPAAWALVSLAQSYMEQSKFDEATRTYDRLMKDFGKDPNQEVKALLGLGSIEELRKQYKAALTHYEKAAVAAKNDSDTLTAKGAVVRLTAELGDIDKAKTLFDELKKQYPEQPKILESIEFTIANAYAKSNDFEKAIAKLEDIRKRATDEQSWGNATLTIGNLYLNLGRPDQAEQYYVALEKKFPADENFARVIMQGRVQIYLTQKQYDKAAAELEKILARFDDNLTLIQSLSQLARLYVDKGNLTKAENTYMRLEKVAESDAGATYELNAGLAEILSRKGRQDKAIERYRKAYEFAPSDNQKVRAMTNIAGIYTAQGKFDQAQKVYKELETAFAQNPGLLTDAKIGQAVVARQNGNFDQALSLYRDVSAKALDAQARANADVSIAQILAEQGQTAQAETAYKDALAKYGSIKGAVLDIKNGLAGLYNVQGKTDEALKTYKEIEQLAVDENMKLSALSSQAQILSDKGEFDEAEKVYREVIEKARFNPNAKFSAEMGLAGILVSRRQSDRALTVYRKLASQAKDPNQKVSAMNSMAGIYLQSKQFGQAERIYKELIDTFQDNRNTQVDAKLGLANVYKENKQYDKAMAGFDEIIEQYGDTMQAYWAYMGQAQILSQQGNIEAAAATYETIGRKFPESATGVADAKLNLANMLKNTNRRGEALEAYDEVITTFPKSSHAVWALQGQAQIYADAADYQKAEKVYDRIIQDFANNPDAVADARLGKAGLLASAGKPADSVKAYESLVPSLPKEKALQARMSAAHSYLALQKPDQAEGKFQEIVQNYSGEKDAVLDAELGLGEVAMAKGEYSKAAGVFRKVADKAADPSRANAGLQALARALVEQEKFDELEPIIETIGKLNPDDVNSEINIRLSAANKLRFLKQYDDAMAQLTPVIRKYQGHPQAAWAEHSMAQCLTEQQKFDEAEALYNQIIEKYSTNQTAIVDAKLNIGQIELYRGNQDRALEIFQRIAATYPEFQQSVTALFNVTQIYEQREAGQQLENAYQQILQRYSGNQTAFINAAMGLGNYYLRNRNPQAALVQFKSIYEKYPDNNQSAWAMSSAAQAYLQMNDQANAEPLLKGLIAKFPDETEVVDGAKKTLEELYTR